MSHIRGALSDTPAWKSAYSAICSEMCVFAPQGELSITHVALPHGLQETDDVGFKDRVSANMPTPASSQRALLRRQSVNLKIYVWATATT